MAEPATSASNASTTAASDPYVIYQLRKPSQRGTAVIPRFVPNTHAPAFSPANYRFARVWATDSNAPPNSLLHVPRSFEYAASLGSESSLWSDTSSWISGVSSMRTAQSDHRQPLLHPASPPNVSAAAFFSNDYTLTPNPMRSPSAHSSERDQRIPFRYPLALSETVSEDAVIDDLLSARIPQFPSISSTAPPSRPAPAHSAHHQSTRHAIRDAPRSRVRSGILPALTRKRRSLWQWLFCADHAALSTTVPSVTAPPLVSIKENTGDRVPGADKDFLNRAQKARDLPKPKRRAPSFELRRGRPDREATRRSVSWSFVPMAFLGREQKRRKPPSTKPVLNEDVIKEGVRRTRKKKKDQPRAYVEEQDKDDPRGGNRFAFARAFAGLGAGQARKENGKVDDARRSDAKREDGRRGGARVNERKKVDTKVSVRKKGEGKKDDGRRAEGKKDGARRFEGKIDEGRAKKPQDRPREDRPREHRPRHGVQPQSNETASVAPVQKSVVSSLREKKGVGSMPPLTQRMTSADSSDPVTSRISSDLSSTLERSMGSRSGNSTPVQLGTYRGGVDELDPATNSSDISSHASGRPGKSSPNEHLTIPGVPEPPVGLNGIDFRTFNAALELPDPQSRSGLFAFPSSSTESGGMIGPGGKKSWETRRNIYPEYSNVGMVGALYNGDGDTMMADQVAREMEKNRTQTAADPLSYLMEPQHHDMDVDTQSTGLTSLADESVSTHKTISAVEDVYRMIPPSNGVPRYQNGIPKQVLEFRDDLSDSSGSAHAQQHIFKNSVLFSHNRPLSPSHLSSASPRRFHSDWSDPHATDIDVYCQCNCSCVYEEECRRSCDLVYGRSPSVSSTRSCSRRGGFQSLQPGADGQPGQKVRKPSSDVQGSNNSRARGSARNPNGRIGESQRGYGDKRKMRSSAVEEVSDPRSYPGHSTSSVYSPDPLSYQPYNIYTQRNHDECAHIKSGDHGRAQPYEDRPRKDHRENNGERAYRDPVQIHKDSHGARSPAQKGDVARSNRRHDTSPRHRSSPHREGRPDSKEQRSRPSSRSTNSSRQGSGTHKDRDGTRSARREEFSEAISTEKRRREAENRGGHSSSRRRADGTQQMGNSYVLKRNGPAPFNQSSVPQPYKASGHGREISYDYDDEKIQELSWRNTLDGPDKRHDTESPIGYGPTPTVELEYDSSRVSSPDMYRSSAARSGGKVLAQKQRTGMPKQDRDKYQKRETGQNNGHQSSRKTSSGHHGHRARKDESRPSSKQSKPSSRQSPRNGTQGRAPLFGIF